MKAPELTFVIPTYRLRDVAETVDAYDEHFWRNGHDVRIVVFDDGTAANREKYYALLEQNPTYNPVFYVGPAEKEQFLAYVSARLRDKKLGALTKSLFRPSYGGNRNFTLMYTLGELMVSSDDDMRPHALMAGHYESLGENEVAHGRLMRRSEGGYAVKSTISFDYEGVVDAEDCTTILDRIRALHSRVLAAGRNTSDRGRSDTLRTFGVNLERAFYGFEPDFFQQNVARLVDDVVTEIKASLELWPTLVEICFFEKSRRGLPQTLVANARLR